MLTRRRGLLLGCSIPAKSGSLSRRFSGPLHQAGTCDLHAFELEQLAFQLQPAGAAVSAQRAVSGDNAVAWNDDAHVVAVVRAAHGAGGSWFANHFRDV